MLFFAPRPDRRVSAVARGAPLVNLANGLTAVRLAVVPVFVFVALASHLQQPNLRLAAGVVFCLAAVTDFVDGWIARTWNLVTNFGVVADPIADKALIGSALLLLSGYGRVLWWITVVIVVREIGVTLLRLWIIRRGVLAASRGGKIKTMVQIIAIAWYLFPMPAALSWVGPFAMAAAVVVTVVTGVDYLVRAVRLRRAAPA